jgi:hypothetical protein
MILLEFLKRNAPNPSGFSLWGVAKSIVPKPTLSLGIPPDLAALPPATAVSELAAAQFVTPTETPAPGPPDPPDSGSAAAPVAVPPHEPDLPSSPPTGGSAGASSGGSGGASSPGGSVGVPQAVNGLSQFPVSIVRCRPTERSRRRTCTAAPHAIEVGRC